MQRLSFTAQVTCLHHAGAFEAVVGRFGMDNPNRGFLATSAPTASDRPYAGGLDPNQGLNTQFTASSSTVKVRSALGGITRPAPAAP